jgi:hypothetical protein
MEQTEGICIVEDVLYISNYIGGSDETVMSFVLSATQMTMPSLFSLHPTRMTQKRFFVNLLLSRLDGVCVRQHLQHSDLMTKLHVAGCSSSLLCATAQSNTYFMFDRNNSVIFSLTEDDDRH